MPASGKTDVCRACLNNFESAEYRKGPAGMQMCQFSRGAEFKCKVHFVGKLLRHRELWLIQGILRFVWAGNRVFTARPLPFNY